MHLPASQNTNAKKKGKKQFVFLKQRSTNISIYTGSEMIIQVVDSCFKMSRHLTLFNRLRKERLKEIIKKRKDIVFEKKEQERL